MGKNSGRESWGIRKGGQRWASLYPHNCITESNNNDKNKRNRNKL